MKSNFHPIHIILLFSSFFASCKNPSSEPIKSTPQIITYDLKELPEKTTINISDLGAIDIKYIPLETTEQNVMAGIEKIIMSRDFLLIKHYRNIYMYRFNGSFVTKIGTIGRGPDEFTVIHDVEINPQNETIYLIDGWQQKFLVYSNTGKFIRTFKYPLRASVDFEFTEDGILCYNRNSMGDIETSFILIDTVGTILRSYPNKYSWTRNFPTMAYPSENIFYHFRDCLIKKEMYSDTLFVFKNKDFKPYSIIDIGNRRLSPEIRSKYDFQFIYKNYLIQKTLFEFPGYLYYRFGVYYDGKLEGLSFIGSKDGNLQILIDPEKDIINDIDGGPNILPETMLDEKTMVSWIEPIDLKAYVNSETFKNSNPKNSTKKSELENMSKNLKDTDNPVIILINFN